MRGGAPARAGASPRRAPGGSCSTACGRNTVTSSGAHRRSASPNSPSSNRAIDLGRHLLELTALPMQEVWAQLCATVRAARARTLERASAMQAADDALSPAHRRRLQRSIARSRAALSDDAYFVPADLAGVCRDAHHARTLAVSLVNQTGRLLAAWPALVKAALDLRSRGDRLAAVVGRRAAHY
jgi:hypothetical protein